MPLPEGVIPREYQVQLFHMVRESLRENRAVLAEAATGSGKSVLMSMIVDSFNEKNKLWKLDRHLYFLVDEKFLLWQFSGHLEKWGIVHDVITAGMHERHVNVHVCTVQSLRRRPPKHDVAFFIVDEAHFSTSPSFMDLFHSYPDAKILGLTASPETGSGKGLAADWVKDENGYKIIDEATNRPLNLGNGIFDIMVESPVTMKDLTELEFLSPIKYYGVPMKGIETLHMTQGDYKLDEVEKLLKEKGTFGDAIKEMQKFPHVKSHILFFCKSVKACYDMQTILEANYYTAEVLEGRLTKKQRNDVMNNFASGKTQILVTCKMVLKGADLPYLLMSVDAAPSPSRGTQRQKIGRGSRTYENKETGFIKEYFVYLDMVGNHRVFPGSDIYAKIDWNFDSKIFNKKPRGTGEENVCPLCFALIPVGQEKCPECGAERVKPKKKEKPEKHLDGELVEIVPVKLADRPEEEKAEIQNAINAAIHDQDILKLYEIALTVTTKRKAPFYIYHKMNSKEKVLDVPLIYRIQRELGFKPGYAYFMKKQLKERMTA